MRSRGWPVTLTGETPTGLPLQLRPLRRRDGRELLAVRSANAEWLQPWDPTTPPGAGPRPDAAKDFRAYRRGLETSARSGSAVPLLVTSQQRVVGQVTASSIVEGAARSATLGYWVVADLAGRWVAPTAVALLGDHLMSAEGRALHRLEINIRPENHASLAVVRKLGMRDEGLRRGFLHIDGDWRDHRSFALLAEEVGSGGLCERLSRAYQESLARHTD